MTLTHPEPEFKNTRKLAEKLEANWKEIVLPPAFKNRFKEAWVNRFGHNAMHVRGSMKLYTSEANSENIADVDLAKAIASYPLRKNLHTFKEKVLSIVDDAEIRTKFRNFYKSTVSSEPPFWQALEALINDRADLNDPEKTELKSFLTDSERFYKIKGIMRNDFANPALCKAVRMRVDRFSICDDIAHAATEGIFQELCDFINNVETFTPPRPLKTYTLSGRGSIRLINSLLAKPLTILTGTSGTGKTKLAELIAQHFRNHEEAAKATNFAIVPVGADWTDNRNVLGFVNHLREDGLEDKRPIYQSTKVLDLMLEANNFPSAPYFLILDEMNLSHVERYFADFLSTMEQKDGHLFLHDEGPREDLYYKLPRFSGDTEGVPRKLRYPTNLFVIGTVNIDETTYMFSPKVLDRANVIEFNVTENDIASFLNEPGGYPPAEKAADGTGEAFLALALKAQNDSPDEGLEPLPDSVKTQANAHILKFFTILKAGRFEFAFRSSKEVLRYLRICRHLSGNQADWDSADWKADLDDQVLQKLLPKLHGSVGRIGGLLAELAHYCATGEPRAEDAASLNLKDVLLLSEDGAAFPRSLKKLRSMVDTLLDEQFVSFVH